MASNRLFHELIEAQWVRGHFLAVGLDPDVAKMPVAVKKDSVKDAIVTFNRAIIDATHDLVCAYKPNSAFFEAYGSEGMGALRETIVYIHTVAPNVPVILDAKRGDIGNTNNGYAAAAFDWLQADALTVHPYLGSEAIQPFLDRVDKGVFVLCRTSNKGAAEFQDLDVGGMPLYQKVARQVAGSWNANGNCAVVVGATYPEELKQVRAIVGDMPILVPGIGAQGGDVEASVKAAKNSRGQGMIINTARAVLYASNGGDFTDAARAEVERTNSAIQKVLLE